MSWGERCPLTIGSVVVIVCVLILLALAAFAVQSLVPESYPKRVALVLLGIIAVLAAVFWVFGVIGFHPSMGTRIW